jgi:hypothetical protein
MCATIECGDDDEEVEGEEKKKKKTWREKPN